MNHWRVVANRGGFASPRPSAINKLRGMLSPRVGPHSSGAYSPLPKQKKSKKNKKGGKKGGKNNDSRSDDINAVT